MTTIQPVQLTVRLLVLAIATVLLQTAALSQLSLFGATPDIAPLVVISVGLLAGPLAGALMGFSVGLLVDVALLQFLLGVETPVSVELLRQTVSTTLINTLIALPVYAFVRWSLGSSVEQHRRRRRRHGGARPLSPLIQP